MKYQLATIFAFTVIATSVQAIGQTPDEELPVAASNAAPMVVQRAEPQVATLVLPANTELTVQMNQDVTTRGRQWSEGDNFDMTVVEDVMAGDYVVIPRGSRAVGHISWMTDKGAFGKSGKMDIEIDYAIVSGRRIPLNGTFRQEGEGNTVATVAGVVAAGPFAAFITGRSGLIPQGRELTAFTEEDLPLTISGPPPAPAPRAAIAVGGTTPE